MRKATGREAAAGSIHAQVLMSKLGAPVTRPNDLPREALVQAMLTGGSRLLLLLAAAGFGKTTLLQQFRSAALAVGRSVIWLRVDAADNDLDRFVSHLRAGFESARTQRRASAATTGVPALLQRIAAHPTPFAILLDDFEAIHPDGPVTSYVQQLIEVLPRHGMLVIASRHVPGFGLGRLRARGQLREIGPDALRFSEEEITRFLLDHQRLPLSDSDIRTLHQRTEGWATAIYLASLSLRGQSERSDVVASFSGSNLELAQYLAEDVLARQSAERRDFLLCTSVLDRFCAPLCEAVTGRTDSATMIAELEQFNLFLIRDDSRGHWYRYHGLFAEFLRDRLERDHPGRSRDIHRRAARWYCSVDQLIPAIEHLLQSGSEMEALQAIAQSLPFLKEAGRARLLVRWLDRISPGAIGRMPRLGLAYAWALALCRRHRDALRVIDEARSDDIAEREELALEIRSVRCLVLAMTDRIEECHALACLHIERIPPDQTFQYGVVANALIFSLIAMCRYDDARRMLSRTVQHEAGLRAGCRLPIRDSFESTIDLIQGRLGNALARLRTAVAMLNSSPHVVSGIDRASTCTPLAIALYECDALDEVRQLLMNAMPSTRGSGSTDALITSHVLFARIAFLRGEEEAAHRTLDTLEQIGRSEASSRTVCSAWLERARRATLTGNFAAAEQALQQTDLHREWVQPGISMYANDVDLPFVGRVRLDLALGRVAHLPAALGAEMERASADQRRRYEIKLRMLLAMALFRLQRESEAFDSLTLALRMASHEGFVRSFLDEGGQPVQLLQRWADRHGSEAVALGVHPRFVENLLSRSRNLEGSLPEAAATDADCEESGTSEPLSQRELQVLRLLSVGFRNRIIAAKLFISEFTVKSHLRSISAKLGARGRLEVIALARRRGLID